MYINKGTVELENVQKKVVKMIKGLEYLLLEGKTKSFEQFASGGNKTYHIRDNDKRFIKL